MQVKKRIAQVFWLSFLAVSLLYAGYSFYAPANEVHWLTDVDKAKELAQAEGRPMVYFLTATWCSPCRIMKREVWADAEVEAMVNEGFVAVLVDVDDPQYAPVLERYNVRGTPWTIITDAQDQVLDYRYGAIPKAEFMAMMSQSAANGSRR